MWLLSEVVDLLPALLLPLAGPEQFEEEDMEQLPLDLQYLPEDKTREPDPDIRTMLLEALLKVRPKLGHSSSCSGQRFFPFCQLNVFEIALHFFSWGFNMHIE